MRKLLIPLAALVLVIAAGSHRAEAGGSPHSFGVGFEQMIVGPGGASVVFDGGKFHVGGFFGFGNDRFAFNAQDQSDVDLGAQFFFHVHSTAMSDFGLGGGLGLTFLNRSDPNMKDLTYMDLDLGAQIRLFVVSNVALSGTMGLSIGTVDGHGVAFGGTPMGSFGVHYYFF